MPNTVTQRTLLGGVSSRYVVRQITIVSDGSEETDLVIYDNSAFINNVNKGNLMKLQVSGSSCLLKLEWDATADVPIISIDPSGHEDMCFEAIGGIPNPGGTGATGDVLLTTTGLDAGDEVTIIITVKQ